MSELAAAVRDDVTRKLYASAGQLDWENLSSARKSAQYSHWMVDPEIGGKLTAFLSEDRARLWIKDGPMKEYARAQFGVGPFAHLVATPRCTPETVVRAAQGEDWEVVTGSVLIKPARCVAARSEDQALVLWGNAADFKHLIWAALESIADENDPAVTIAVVERAARPTGKAERARLKSIADRCGFVVRHINPAPTVASASG